MTLKRYIVMTGKDRYQEVAASFDKAVIAAFKRRAPASPGLLTRARILGKHPWMYIATDTMLRRAGYKVTSSAEQT